ncbi:helix-turn-helix transcriptional regulator [Methylobacterium pseudosasicola]|uniref:AraC-type DNA-binding protein n=1 Tax=Methylobacterium pseudosasicola TaxID=582667 RepID=A0A1I4H317_9HYPH|nr:helix-turn-helix transcriptional regulator [Methylobacterium pseudosasicola]SFL36654.1 AraC-type DNA-binding protein [Methylobacterium pseudosasicola]
MANILRPAKEWEHWSVRPATLLHHEEPEWQFSEVEYGPGGAWDVVTTCLHIASHPDPIRQRLGSARTPFRTVAPSAAISAPGDHLTGAWEGRGRGQHVMVSPIFVAAAFERDVDATAVPRRRFAYQRECDGADTIIRNLLGAMSIHIRDGNPGEAVFMQTIVLALVHHALPAPWTRAEFAASRGGLSRHQLAMAIDMIEARLLGRPSHVELASALNVSTRYFCRAFRRSTGLSPHQFIIKRRVSLARALIEGSELSLTEVAFAAGFGHHSQMTATFRQVLGIPPSHFRNRRWGQA